MAQFNINLSSFKSKRYNANPIWIRQDDSPDTIRVACDDDLNVTANSVFEFDSTKFDKQIIQDKNQSSFKYFEDVDNKEEGFIYTLPKEMYQSSGATTATFFRVDGTSTSNFPIYILKSDGASESNSYISTIDDITNQMNSTYASLQEILENSKVDTAEMTEKISSLQDNLKQIEKLIDDNNVIKKTEAQDIITGIVEGMDLKTDDNISDPDVLAKIQRLGAI